METKVCSVCGIEYPATLEYFNKEKHGKYGLRSKCRECRSAEKKQYYETHKEKTSINRKLYYELHKEQEKEAMKLYRVKNKEYLNEMARLYQINNKEERKQYRERKKEYFKEKHKQYKLNNPDYNKTNCQRRKAKKMSLPNDLTIQQWEECKKTFNNKCCYCGKDGVMTQEHFVPLSKGGEYTINNIIPACASCNFSKHNKDFFEWYPQQKFYNKKREQKILKYLNYNNGIQQLALTI